MGTGSEPRQMPNLQKDAAGSVPVPLFRRGLWEASLTAIRTTYNSNPVAVEEASHTLQFPGTLR